MTEVKTQLHDRLRTTMRIAYLMSICSCRAVIWLQRLNLTAPLRRLSEAMPTRRELYGLGAASLMALSAPTVLERAFVAPGTASSRQRPSFRATAQGHVASAGSSSSTSHAALAVGLSAALGAGAGAARAARPARSPKVHRAQGGEWTPRLSGWTAAELAGERQRAQAMPDPPGYNGPRYTGPGSITDAFIDGLLAMQKDGQLLPKKDAYLILLDIIDLLRSEKTLGQASIPAGGQLTVIGDLHGQYWDFLNLLSMTGKPSASSPFVFNGDFVDRGSWSIEVILSIFALKLKDPQSVFLNRGNHEMLETNILYGFCGECGSKYDMELFNLFSEAFRNLPLAHLVDGKVLILHGGLPGPDPRIWMPGQTHDPTDAIPMTVLPTLEDIGAVDRYLEITPESYGQSIGPTTTDKEVNDMRKLIDILWGDPRGGDGYGPSYRKGKGVYMFGPDVTSNFCEKNNLQCIIRSHEVKADGYRWDHKQLLSVFSAPNYLDTGNNKGAFLKLTKSADGSVAIDPVNYAAVPHPDVPPMKWQDHITQNYSHLTRLMKKKVSATTFDEFGDSDFEGLMNFDEWEPDEAEQFQEAFKDFAVGDSAGSKRYFHGNAFGQVDSSKPPLSSASNMGWNWFLLPLAAAQLEPFALPPSFEGTWQGVPYASVVGPWSENFTFAITKLPQGDYLFQANLPFDASPKFRKYWSWQRSYLRVSGDDRGRLLHCPGPRDPTRLRVAMMQAHTVSEREVTFCLRKWPGYVDSEHPFPFETLGCYTAGTEEGCGCFNWTLRAEESGRRLQYQVSMAGSPFHQRSKHVWATLERIPYIAPVDLEFPGSGSQFDCDYTHRDEHQTPLASCPFALHYRSPPEVSTVAAGSFQHCYNLDAKVGLVLEWDLHETTSSLHVQISARADTADYVSIGFRPLGGSSSESARSAGTGREERFGMAGADIVLGHTGGVEQYYASAYSGAPDPDDSLQIWDASVEKRGGRLFLRFRRPLVGGWLHSHGVNASILSNLSDMMWAVGRWSQADRAPAYHGFLRGWREVDWADPELDSRPLLSLRRKISTAGGKIFAALAMDQCFKLHEMRFHTITCQMTKLAGAQGGQNAKDAPELPKPEMHITDMSKAEVDFAIEVAKKGVISLFKNERRSFCEVAQFIKKEFDKLFRHDYLAFQGAWHVFVGKHFGAWVTYEAHKLVYFHIGQAGFLIYKHG
ncbi:PAPP5 [Symbiodinium microadriaticum]|nr:PAPP5 [Symbiodinium microadriaticum]CAE7843545.1 PAPP5 [Symbiodinium sp. KB8]